MLNRKFACRSLVLTVGMIALPATAISWDGNGDGYSWNDPVNWLGNVMPGSTDTASIGDQAAIKNAFLDLNINDTLGGLNVYDGMRLVTNGHSLLVNGDTYLSGYNTVNQGGIDVGYSSGINVERGAGADDFDTDNLTLVNQARVSLRDGGILEIDNVANLASGTAISGDGEIRFAQGSGTVLINNGGIGAGTGGMLINVSGTGLLDLDGVSGNGTVAAGVSKIDGSAFAHMTINGKGLTDAFDGEMTTIANGFIDMNLSDGWTLGSGGLLRMFGNASHPGTAEIRGGDLTINGSVYVGGGPAQGVFKSNVAAQAGSNFDVNLDDILTFDGATNSFTGATFDLKDGATVNFNNNTTMQSATFNFVNPAQGSAQFNGPTTYSYNTTINSNGLIQQNGDMTVVGSMVVNGGKFDLDGVAGTTTLHLGNGANPGTLTLNVDGIDTGNNIFNGTINTANAGLSGGLVVNLPGSTPWVMAGTLNLAGTSNLFNPTRISGSRMIVSGTVNLADNKPTNIAADTDFNAGAVINTFTNGRLSLSGSTRVYNGATFNGTGTLRNNGTMRLAHGVDLNDVKLLNNGTLSVGNSPGAVVVPDFQQTANGSWQVEIGGTSPGTEHDRLNVAGTASLGGEIDLTLYGGYDPAMLDEVTVLSSFNRVGTFDTVAGVEYVPGKALAVTYTVTDVLVTATIIGDFDLDGDVDDADLGTAFANYNGPGNGGNGWAQGDTDGDGDVDDADLGAAFAYYTGPLAPAAVAVPEPGSIALLVLGGVMASRRRQA